MTGQPTTEAALSITATILGELNFLADELSGVKGSLVERENTLLSPLPSEPTPDKPSIGHGGGILAEIQTAIDCCKLQVVEIREILVALSGV